MILIRKYEPKPKLFPQTLSILQNSYKTSWANARVKIYSPIHFGLWITISYRVFQKKIPTFVLLISQLPKRLEKEAS